MGSGPDHPVGGRRPIAGAVADFAGGASADFAGGASADLAGGGETDLSVGAAADFSGGGAAPLRASSRGDGFSVLVPHAAIIPQPTKTTVRHIQRIA